MIASAVDDLKEALRVGENIEKAIAEIAEEYGIPPHALRNRAIKAFGPLETYAQKSKNLSAKIEAEAARSREKRKEQRRLKFLREFRSLEDKFRVSPSYLTIERLKVVKDIVDRHGVLANDFSDIKLFFELLTRCEELNLSIETEKERNRKARSKEQFRNELKLLGPDYIVSPSSLPKWRLAFVKELADRYRIVPEDFDPSSILHELIKRSNETH